MSNQCDQLCMPVTHRGSIRYLCALTGHPCLVDDLRPDNCFRHKWFEKKIIRKGAITAEKPANEIAIQQGVLL